jgi:hypothetical protein
MDADCPADLPLCGPQGCQVGNEGEPCIANADCNRTAPFCASDGQCHDGSLGDPCAGNGDCSAAPLCGPDGCQLGDEGDPCMSNGACNNSAPFCAPDGMCHDGSDGDPCSGDPQCTTPLTCSADICS